MKTTQGVVRGQLELANPSAYPNRSTSHISDQIGESLGLPPTNPDEGMEMLDPYENCSAIAQ